MTEQPETYSVNCGDPAKNPAIPWKAVRSCACGHLRAAHNYNSDPLKEWTDGDIALINAAPELAELLRELHDFCVPTTDHRHRAHAITAMRKAGEILERLGK